MADPAVEAAQRAWVDRDLAVHRPRFYMEAAATEALKPIREWQQRMTSAYALDDRPEGVLVEAVLQELATLIYSTEELNHV